MRYTQYFLFCYILISYSDEAKARTHTIHDFQSMHQDPISIRCSNSTTINITNTTITSDEDSHDCKGQSCRLDDEDLANIRHNCDGAQSCLVDTNFTTKSLHRSKSVNILYMCKTPNVFCDFELKETCNWILGGKVLNDTSDWRFYSGTDGSSKRLNKPAFDHTNRNVYGKFAYLKAGPSKRTRVAVLSSPTLLNGDKLLTFWYSAKGNYTLTVKYQHTNSSLVNKIFNTSEVRPWRTWMIANVDIDVLGTYNIYIEGVLKPGKDSYIAIDDINVLDRSCDESVAIIDTFDNGLGSWTFEGSDTLNWSIDSCKDRRDRQVRRCITFSAEPGEEGVVQLSRNISSTFRKLSLQLWYGVVLKEDTEAEINIYQDKLSGEDKKHLSYLLLERDHKLCFNFTDSLIVKTCYEFKELAVNIDITSPSTIIIEVKFSRSLYKQTVVIDDIHLKKGHCFGVTTIYREYNIDIGIPTTLQTCPSLYPIDDIRFDFGENNNLKTCAKAAEEYVLDYCQKLCHSKCTFNLSEIGKECFDVGRNITIDYSCIKDVQLDGKETSSDKIGITVAITLVVIAVLIMIVVLICIVRRKQNGRRAFKAIYRNLE